MSTARGFPDPQTRAQRDRHANEQLLVLRISSWELDQLRLRNTHPMGLDGTFGLQFDPQEGSWCIVKVDRQST